MRAPAGGAGGAHLLRLEARHAVHRVRRRAVHQRRPGAVPQRSIRLQRSRYHSEVPKNGAISAIHCLGSCRPYNKGRQNPAAATTYPEHVADVLWHAARHVMQHLLRCSRHERLRWHHAQLCIRPPVEVRGVISIITELARCHLYTTQCMCHAQPCHHVQASVTDGQVGPCR
jgi:hypothetical protein